MVGQRFLDRAVEIMRCVVSHAAEVGGSDVVIPSARQCASAGVVADYNTHLGVKTSLSAGINDRLHGRARVGGKDTEAEKRPTRRYIRHFRLLDITGAIRHMASGELR